MTTSELRTSVCSKLEAAIHNQRESWDMACELADIASYAGDIYGLGAELAGALNDDETIPEDVVGHLVACPGEGLTTLGDRAEVQLYKGYH